ncbi:MAG TPA: tRNA lysidine(34) synthetase TilS [Methylomirabilota bacterium]|nr:tRNA lysidine(34) synthetase TilS [Methylomirabilota bacterium]
MAGPTGPVADNELDPLFTDLAELGRIGVAVSGGPDSTALLVLLGRWRTARDRSQSLHVLTVDHGLRAGSRGDCERVVRLAGSLGVPASILEWTHPGGPPTADIQAAARDARYRLLADAARTHALDAVALAHTLEDKAETLLMRLSRGSGLSGLAAMERIRTAHGARFIRPLMSLPKARLKATLTQAGIDWVEDPANSATDRFLRAKVRALAPALAEIGLTTERLAATADRLARANDAVDRMTGDLAGRALVDHGGVASIDAGALVDAPEEVALRLIVAAHGRVRPGPYGPRTAGIEQALADLRADPGTMPRRTAGGVVLDPVGDRLWLYAEAGRSGYPTLTVECAGTHVWDGRFEIVVRDQPSHPFTVRAAEGNERRTDLPRRAAGSLPVVVGAAPSSGGLSPPEVVLRQVTQV